MNIGIVGLGHVGGAVRFGFETKRGHNVSVYDKKLSDTSLKGLLANSELVFICVDTPQKSDGSCDTSNVEALCTEINMLAESEGKVRDVVIKSTVEPGTSERLAKQLNWIRLAVNPEFLLERSAIHDFCHQDICIVGTEYQDLYNKIVSAHGNLAAQFIKTTPVNAELVKYFCNVFNATRIIFANLFYDVAKRVGADYDECKTIATKRHNMIDAYLDCNEHLRGFGGACLPKDANAILAFCTREGVSYKFLRGLLEDNERLNSGQQ
jgi:UDPglucose 6-dehydrogenase